MTHVFVLFWVLRSRGTSGYDRLYALKHVWIQLLDLKISQKIQCKEWRHQKCLESSWFLISYTWKSLHCLILLRIWHSIFYVIGYGRLYCNSHAWDLNFITKWCNQSELYSWVGLTHTPHVFSQALQIANIIFSIRMRIWDGKKLYAKPGEVTPWKIWWPRSKPYRERMFIPKDYTLHHNWDKYRGQEIRLENL